MPLQNRNLSLVPKTKDHECIGKTILDIGYAVDENNQCRDMYLEFSDGSEMAIGVTSDGILVSCMSPGGPMSEPNDDTECISSFDD